VEWGGLERCEGAGYRIGLRMWEIGSLAPRGESPRDAALPVMQDLYEGTKENVHLAVRQDTQALYLDKIHGPDALPVKSRRGGRLPLHSCMGVWARPGHRSPKRMPVDSATGIDPR